MKIPLKKAPPNFGMTTPEWKLISLTPPVSFTWKIDILMSRFPISPARLRKHLSVLVRNISNDSDRKMAREFHNYANKLISVGPKNSE